MSGASHGVGKAAGFTIRTATAEDLSSLTTILPRAFHPKNAFMRETLPDTPAVRQWWRDLFAYCINSSEYQVLIAAPTHIADGPENVSELIGVLLLHHMAAGQKDGCWTLFPPTPDHKQPNYNAMIEAMIEYHARVMVSSASTVESTLTSGRRKDEPHFSIELFGTDVAFQGNGAGSALLKQACMLADEAGEEIFVEANGNANGFYEKMGFREEARVLMPKKDDDEEEYWEVMLLRPRKMM